MAEHTAGSASVCVRIVKVHGGAGPESSHSAYILDGWFAGATLLKHKMMHIKKKGDAVYYEESVREGR